MGDFEGHLLDLGRLQQNIVLLKTHVIYLKLCFVEGTFRLKRSNLEKLLEHGRLIEALLGTLAKCRGRLVIFYRH